MVRYNIASLADMKRGKADESLRYFPQFFIVHQPSPIVVEHFVGPYSYSQLFSR